MGIPKFFRWISERYPLINQTITTTMLPPEIDNLYFDMNGIIHNCTHPSEGSDGVTERLTEEEMFSNIFHYIDNLFHIVKPKKLFYMAIDGVAPRAKLNQQRQRRFRAAKDAKESLEIARGKGIPIPDEPPFDSNCITPGTEFMAKLSTRLKFFIVKKMQEDATWQRCNIIFSGHETPGEGEHKIQEYIRHKKSQPDWDPNTTHCLYGLDADLIMLALTTHEPHFVLLREDVLSKDARKRNKSIIESQVFHLLHIGMVREYLDLEFRDLALPFPYDLERIIDDFVLMCFVVGNDFLPHLPGQDIAEGALNSVLDFYKELLPTMGGYITEGANLNLSRLEMLLNKIAEREKAMFEFISPAHMEKLGLTDNKKPFDQSDKRFERDMQAIGINLAKYEKQFQDDDSWKDAYYMEKFKVPTKNKEYHRQLQQSYIEGLLWVLNYYHNGCISWGWYYPYYYAPLAADLINLTSFKINFEVGRPFLPFQQLLAVLPRESGKLLPEPYERLMNDPSSPIYSFFPKEITIDMNGKSNPWEGVVIIPFMGQQQILEAVKLVDRKQLTKEEIERNSFGPAHLYKYDYHKTHYVFPSPMKSVFQDITDCHTLQIEFTLPPFPYGNHLGFTLCKGVKLGPDAPPGFPTFATLPFTHIIKHVGVNIFGNESRKDSVLIILNIGDQNTNSAVSLIGKPCFVDWPYLKEAKVVAVSDIRGRHSVRGTLFHSAEQAENWKRDAEWIQSSNRSKKALDLGKVTTMIHVNLLEGLQENSDGSKAKKWAENEQTFPFQVISTTYYKKDSRYNENAARSVVDRFPIGTEVIYVGDTFYGSRGHVIAHDHNTVKVEIRAGPQQPTFGKAIEHNYREKYFPMHSVSKMLGISSRTLSKITASCLFEPGKQNLGLNMKFSGKNQQLMGYTRQTQKPGYENHHQSRSQGQWEFSEKAVSIIQEYQQKYPEVFQLIEAKPDTDMYNIHDLFAYQDPVKANGEQAMELESDSNDDDAVPAQRKAWMKGLKEWLKKLEVNSLPRVPVGSLAIPPEGIKKVEEEANKYVQAAAKTTKLKALSQVEPHLLIEPSTIPSQLVNFSKFSLGDRVTVVSGKEKIPFASQGTIVAIKGDLVDVVFDEQFIGGTSLSKLCSDLRGGTIPTTSLLNLSRPVVPPRPSKSTHPRPQTQRQEVFVPKSTAQVQVPAKSAATQWRSASQHEERDTTPKATPAPQPSRTTLTSSAPSIVNVQTQVQPSPQPPTLAPAQSLPSGITKAQIEQQIAAFYQQLQYVAQCLQLIPHYHAQAQLQLQQLQTLDQNNVEVQTQTQYYLQYLVSLQQQQSQFIQQQQAIQASIKEIEKLYQELSRDPPSDPAPQVSQPKQPAKEVPNETKREAPQVSQPKQPAKEIPKDTKREAPQVSQPKQENQKTSPQTQPHVKPKSPKGRKNTAEVVYVPKQAKNEEQQKPAQSAQTQAKPMETEAHAQSAQIQESPQIQAPAAQNQVPQTEHHTAQTQTQPTRARPAQKEAQAAHPRQQQPKLETPDQPRKQQKPKQEYQPKQARPKQEYQPKQDAQNEELAQDLNWQQRQLLDQPKERKTQANQRGRGNNGGNRDRNIKQPKKSNQSQMDGLTWQQRQFL